MHRALLAAGLILAPGIGHAAFLARARFRPARYKGVPVPAIGLRHVAWGKMPGKPPLPPF